MHYQHISADHFQAREAFRREAEAAGDHAYPIDAPGPGGTAHD